MQTRRVRGFTRLAALFLAVPLYACGPAPDREVDFSEPAAAPAAARSPSNGRFTYSNFRNTANLHLVGVAKTVGSASSGPFLRLTSSVDTGSAVGAAWHATRMNVDEDFLISFDFAITDGGGIDGGGDGFALVIQNDGPTAIGGGGCGIGYAGIQRSVAVEFDTFLNTYYCDLHDPSANHISVHTDPATPAGANSADEQGYSAGISPDTFAVPLRGTRHHVVVAFRKETRSLSVYLDGLEVVNATVDIAAKLGSPVGWVGFTAGSASAWENHDILNWHFQGRVIPPCQGQAVLDLADNVSCRAMQGATSFGRNEYLALFEAAEIRTGVPADILKAIAYSEGLGDEYHDLLPRQFLEPDKGEPDIRTRFDGAFGANAGSSWPLVQECTGGSCVTLHPEMGIDPSGYTFGIGIMQNTLDRNVFNPPFQLLQSCRDRNGAAISCPHMVPFKGGGIYQQGARYDRRLSSYSPGVQQTFEACVASGGIECNDGNLSPIDLGKLMKDPQYNVLVAAQAILFDGVMPVYANRWRQFNRQVDSPYCRILHTGVQYDPGGLYGTARARQDRFMYLAGEYKSVKGYTDPRDIAEHVIRPYTTGNCAQGDVECRNASQFARDQPICPDSLPPCTPLPKACPGPVVTSGQ